MQPALLAPQQQLADQAGRIPPICPLPLQLLQLSRMRITPSLSSPRLLCLSILLPQAWPQRYLRGRPVVVRLIYRHSWPHRLAKACLLSRVFSRAVRLHP
jgi:hypothetical protein